MYELADLRVASDDFPKLFTTDPDCSGSIFRGESTTNLDDAIEFCKKQVLYQLHILFLTQTSHLDRIRLQVHYAHSPDCLHTRLSGA
jgi:hypothetical protein